MSDKKQLSATARYPNLAAHAQGCTDSNIQAWTAMRSECQAVLEEIDRLKEIEADSNLVLGHLWQEAVDEVHGVKEYNQEKHVGFLAGTISELQAENNRLREACRAIVACRVPIDPYITWPGWLAAVIQCKEALGSAGGGGVSLETTTRED